MPVSRESLALAFPDDRISVIAPDRIPAGVTDRAARRILAEVGFPEGVESWIFLSDLDEPLETLARFRKSDPLPVGAGNYYVVGFTSVSAICMDGVSGRCYFVGNRAAAGQVRLAASTLEGLLDFLSQLNVAMSNEGLERVEDRLIRDLRVADPGAVAASEEAWRYEISLCIAEVMR